jgi:hypothetical protein
VAGRRHTFRGSRLTVAILVIAATVWGLAAWAGSLRDGGGSPAQVTGALPGQALWTYYNTSGNPAGGGDNILTLINPNGSANSNLGNPAANTCAMIYVFDEDQEMGECCGCPLTPAGIETFSVESDFTSNWGISSAEGQDNSNGSIAIVAVGTNVSKVPAGPLSNGTFCPGTQSAACNSGCDPTDQPGYSVSTATNLLGSIEHNQSIRTGSGMVAIQSGLTETALFDNRGGDPTNLAYLQAQCGALVGNGTGGGICKCPRPDPDAAPSPPTTRTLTFTMPACPIEATTVPRTISKFTLPGANPFGEAVSVTGTVQIADQTGGVVLKISGDAEADLTGVTFSRTVNTIAHMTGQVTFDRGCTKTDPFGTNDCTFAWGESISEAYEGALQENITSGKEVVDLKINNTIPFSFSCPVCGASCTITIPEQIDDSTFLFQLIGFPFALINAVLPGLPPFATM